MATKCSPQIHCVCLKTTVYVSDSDLLHWLIFWSPAYHCWNCLSLHSLWDVEYLAQKGTKITVKNAQTGTKVCGKCSERNKSKLKNAQGMGKSSRVLRKFFVRDLIWMFCTFQKWCSFFGKFLFRKSRTPCKKILCTCLTVVPSTCRAKNRILWFLV